MRIIIKNLEIEISPEELRALQNEKTKTTTKQKPPLEEIFKEEIEAKTKNKIKIGF